MAIFTSGPAIGAISGSVGGSVFSHNKGGPYIRGRTIPTKAVSEYAATVKAKMTLYSQAWQGLNAATQAAWREWAKTNPISNALGQSRIVAGHVAYIRINMTLDLCEFSATILPPVTPPAAALSELSVTADLLDAEFLVSFAPTPTGAAEKLMIWAALVDSKGINYVENLYKLVVVTSVAQVSSRDILGALTNRFGSPQVDQVLHVRVAVLDEEAGIPSGFRKTSAVVVDTTP